MLIESIVVENAGSALGLDVGDTVVSRSGKTYTWKGANWVITKTGKNSGKGLNQIANQQEAFAATMQARKKKGLPPLDFDGEGKFIFDKEGKVDPNAAAKANREAKALANKTEPTLTKREPRVGDFDPQKTYDGLRAIPDNTPTIDELTRKQRRDLYAGKTITRGKHKFTPLQVLIQTSRKGKKVPPLLADRLGATDAIEYDKQKGDAPELDKTASQSKNPKIQSDDLDGWGRRFKEWFKDALVKYGVSAVGGFLINTAVKIYELVQISELYQQYNAANEEFLRVATTDVDVAFAGTDKSKNPAADAAFAKIGKISDEICAKTTDYFCEAIGGAAGTAVAAGGLFFVATPPGWIALLFIGGAAAAAGMIGAHVIAKNVDADNFFDKAPSGVSLYDFIKETIVADFVLDDIVNRAKSSDNALKLILQYQGSLPPYFNLAPLSGGVFSGVAMKGAGYVKDKVMGDSIQYEEDEEEKKPKSKSDLKKEIMNNPVLKKAYVLGKAEVKSNQG